LQLSLRSNFEKTILLTIFMDKKAKKVSESKTIMTEMVMPNDANPLGNLMGGNLLRWMDIAGGICAGKHCEAHVVTASVDHVSFSKPIKIGDVITIEANVTRAFNTSVEIFVEVMASDIKGGNPRRCNHAYYTFVALEDGTLQPTSVPQVIPLSTEEEHLYEGAIRRRELRLVLSGRMKPEDATEIKLLFQNL
jgi:acyl-CoA hydrolase